MIVFVTTCKGRAQHLKLTLPQNLADNADYHDCKFVVLDYSSEDDLLGYLSNFEASLLSGRLSVYSLRGADKFRMAHAKNVAHRCGLLEGADILVNLDADNYTGPGFARWIAENWKDNHFMWARIKAGMSNFRGCSGRIAVTARQFLCAGGYDEKYETWSPDDKDFNARLCRIGFEGIEIDPQFLQVVLHNDKMRFREYKHAKNNGYDFKAVDCTNTIANWGRFGCGTVYKNFGDTPIELRPLPTRIFGIGMHKTGTTSLHHALHILGYDSAHWKSAHWSKAIWREMNTEGRSPTLEKHYALSDFPIAPLYDKLDAAYPGSKFILTVRDEEAWLKSVELHWSFEHNKFRYRWDDDPFTHRIHKAVYGQKEFDREVFLARYRKHNADVLKHFTNRPQDLIVLDVGKSPWLTLCTFLDQAVPGVPYPRKFRTKRRNAHGAMAGQRVEGSESI